MNLNLQLQIKFEDEQAIRAANFQELKTYCADISNKFLSGLVASMDFVPGIHGKIADIKAIREYVKSQGLCLGLADAKSCVEYIRSLREIYN